MSVEEQLRLELETVARSLSSQPEVSVPGLERAGRRERIRGRATLAGAAAAAAVVVSLSVALLTSGVLRSESGPDPAPPAPSPSRTEAPSLADLPEGPPTSVPWWKAGVLHVDGAQIPTPLKVLVFRGGTTVIGRSSVDSGASWFLVSDGELVPLVASQSPVVPEVSPDGSRVVWVEETARQRLGTYRSRVSYRVVAYDVAARQQVDALERTEVVECCDASGSLVVLGIDDAGRVLMTSLGRATALWTPGGGYLELRGPEAELLMGDMWPRGVSWQEQGHGIMDLFGGYGTVADDGTVRQVGTMPDDQRGRWSDDGAAYAYPGNVDGEAPAKDVLDHVWVQRIDAEKPVELRLPPEPSFEIVAWESADAVLLQARQPYGEPGDHEPGLVGLVRCDASSGDCERVADSPNGRAVLPDVY